MSHRKPITAEEAIAIVEKRRLRAREHYARLRADALRHRSAQEKANATRSRTWRSSKLR
jgi:hypothetical protein